MAITSFNIQDNTYKERRCMPRCKKRTILILLAIAIMAIAVITYTITTKKNNEDLLSPPNPTKPLSPSVSELRTFQKAAVCSDSKLCSDIGTEILKKNGSAVDATIATMFCNGLVTMQSMGLGGGFFMTIYSKKENKIYTLNAREAAPFLATPDMFKDDPIKAKTGALASAVPGELAGYIAAYDMFGVLPWKELVQPTIDLCERGFNVSDHQERALKWREKDLEKNIQFKMLFKDPKNNFKTKGADVRHDVYCQTLRNISENRFDLYNGTMGDIFVEDIKEMGGIITKDDLLNYKALWEEPVMVKLKDDSFYSAPSPANGNVLGLILNILQGYNFSKESLSENDTILTHHRIIEAFKHAYGVRTHLGDPKFINLTNFLNEVNSEKFVEEIRNKIKDNETNQDPLYYGAENPTKDDHGTAHISVLSQHGDAVSVTSTINLYFGAAVLSKRTGIILNSGMDDFSSEYVKNYFGIPYSPTNKILPHKRSLSSMSPAIILDKENNVKMVVGAAGGTKIPSSVALVIMRSLWFSEDIKMAVDGPRFHNQLYPMKVDYEYGLVSSIVEGLKKLGHKTTRSKGTGSVINAIFVNNGTVYANADYRKGGDASGF